jgi:hypothetical protein
LARARVQWEVLKEESGPEVLIRSYIITYESPLEQVGIANFMEVRFQALEVPYCRTY